MSISDWGIQAIPVITIIVFLIAEAVKATPLDNKWLPVICGAVGGILGVVGMFLMPEFPAKGAPAAAASIWKAAIRMMCVRIRTHRSSRPAMKRFGMSSAIDRNPPPKSGG